MSVAKAYLNARGYSVEDVSTIPEHKGYDLIARKDAETLRIEVKGCTRPWGIPDPYVTEFDEERRLVADYLYVVRFVRPRTPHLSVIPREILTADFIYGDRARGYFVSATFANRTTLHPFRRAI